MATSTEANPACTSHWVDSTAESAVGALSSTFSQNPLAYAAVSAARSRAISSNLPVEILIIVFNLVYNDAYHLKWLERDIMSPTLFPYALASVCSLWRDAMSLVPKFWRRVVFLVDSPATPMSAILSQLSWSGDVQLDVIVTRRTFHDDVDRDYEKAQIVSIMNIIGSHIHRIRDLRFDVMFSSSLPSFPTDFHGAATVLERLELRCKEDDGSPDRNTSVDLSTPEHEQFRCRQLTSLVIDGRNYYEACKRDARWTEMIPNVWDWTISCFKPRPGESLSSYEILMPLRATNMDALTIADVVLHPSPEELEMPDFLFGQSVVFENMHDFRIMDQIVHSIDPPQLSFIRCTFEHIADASNFFEAHKISLEEIDQDVAPLLRVWYTCDLDIVRCPGFDDATLDAMSSEVNETEFTCAAYLGRLTITDCSNFSIAALRRCVESRLTPLISLHLSGNIPSISEADRAWFEANVPDFFYLRTP